MTDNTRRVVWCSVSLPTVHRSWRDIDTQPGRRIYPSIMSHTENGWDGDVVRYMLETFSVGFLSLKRFRR